MDRNGEKSKDWVDLIPYSGEDVNRPVILVTYLDGSQRCGAVTRYDTCLGGETLRRVRIDFPVSMDGEVVKSVTQFNILISELSGDTFNLDVHGGKRARFEHIGFVEDDKFKDIIWSYFDMSKLLKAV